MTETTPEPAAETPESADPTVEDTGPLTPTEDEETEEDNKYLAEMAARRERRAKEPRVTVQTAIDTHEESWAEQDGPEWNAPYASRPDIKILARRMDQAFIMELPDRRLVDGQAGDWLIKDAESGYVYAITARAFRQLFVSDAPAPAAVEEPASGNPPA